MATEIDKAAEARRKALRNGEEDPMVVAQRFLNIYRQMHIFSAERKEAFNKMLLELSPDIRALFSSLPGGAMLQDYVDDLAEKNGIERSELPDSETSSDDDSSQQTQILAAAMAQAQAQPQIQPQIIQQPVVAPVMATGSATLSIDENFAGEFSKIIGQLLQQQTSLQKDSLEKLTADLSKTQLFIAKNIKESKEEQLQQIDKLCKAVAEGQQISQEERHKEISELCKAVTENQQVFQEERRKEIGELFKVVTEGQQASREERRQDISELCKAMSESYKASQAEQRLEIGELCKAIAQSQTALSASLKAIPQGVSSPAPQVSPIPASAQPTTTVIAQDDGTTKKLIELLLEGQKQLNSRIEKVEQVSTSQSNDNKLLIESFEKSQAEIIKSLSNIQINGSLVQSSDNDEKLVRIIGESQEKLIQTLLSTNFQQNNTTQANTNANNIQITAPDNSAQMMLLVEKIASLQASNEKNMEKAITLAVEAQSELYTKISSKQTQELAKIIADSLKESVRPVYVAPQEIAPAYMSQSKSEALHQYSPEPAPIPRAKPEKESLREYLPENEELSLPSVSENDDNLVDFELNLSDIENMAEEASSSDEEVIEPEADVVESQNLDDDTDEEEAPKKKKRKRRKKKKKILEQEEISEPETPLLPQEETFEFNLEESSNEPEKEAGLTDFLAEEMPTDENNTDLGDFMLPEETTETTDNAWTDTLLPEETELVEEQPLEQSEDGYISYDEDFGQSAEDSQYNAVSQENISPFQEEDSPVDEKAASTWDNFLTEPLLAEKTDDDWGYQAPEPSVPTNDNQEDEEWEWVYVEDDGSYDEGGEDSFAAIGDNSYIGSGSLYHQEKSVGNEPIFYNNASVEINNQPQIFDSANEDEIIDPYQNSILKD